MDQKDFEKLSVDHKWIIISTHQNLLTNSIFDRMRLLPMIAGLAATLLVIATFNNQLIPLDNTVKIVLSMLLILIPISLFLYNSDLKTSQSKNKEEIERLLGTKPKTKNTIFDKIIAWSPDMIIYIVFLVSLILIFKIWYK